MIDVYMNIQNQRAFNQLPSNYESLWNQSEKVPLNIYHKIEHILEPLTDSEIDELCKKKYHGQTKIA